MKNASSRKLVAWGLGAAITVTLAAAACDGPVSHVYSARAYDKARRCLGPNLSIDVLSGADPGAGCAPLCIVGRSSVIPGSPEAIYVTTMCAPHPPTFDISGRRPECVEALAAFSRSDGCLVVDAGPPPDAATPSDAGADVDLSDAGDAGDATDAAFDATDASDAAPE
jgi:hypothetical protein